MVVQTNTKGWWIFLIVSIILLILAIVWLVSKGIVNDAMIDRIMFSGS